MLTYYVVHYTLLLAQSYCVSDWYSTICFARIASLIGLLFIFRFFSTSQSLGTQSSPLFTIMFMKAVFFWLGLKYLIVLTTKSQPRNLSAKQNFLNNRFMNWCSALPSSRCSELKCSRFFSWSDQAYLLLPTLFEYAYPCYSTSARWIDRSRRLHGQNSLLFSSETLI